MDGDTTELEWSAQSMTMRIERVHNWRYFLARFDITSETTGRDRGPADILEKAGSTGV